MATTKKRVCVSLSKEAYDMLLKRTKQGTLNISTGKVTHPTKSMVVEFAILYGRYNGIKIV